MTKFKCQQCGHCCNAVPMSIDIVNKHKDNLPFYHSIQPVAEGIVMVWVNVTNCRCAFLSPFNNCVIYDDRPQICRSYGHVLRMPCPNNPQFPLAVPTSEQHEKILRGE